MIKKTKYQKISSKKKEGKKTERDRGKSVETLIAKNNYRLAELRVKKLFEKVIREIKQKNEYGEVTASLE